MGQEPAGSKQTFFASPSPMEAQHKTAEVKEWLKTTTDLPTAKVPSATEEDAATPPEEGGGEEEEGADRTGVDSKAWNREVAGTAGEEEAEEDNSVIVRRN